MRLFIGAIGRLKDGAERDLFQKYLKRFDDTGRGIALGPSQVFELPEARATGPNERCDDEAHRLLAAVKHAETVVCLDVVGKQYSSEQLARWLGDTRDRGSKAVGFLVGGPDGHGEEALAASQVRLSLGPMTLPHGLARIVLAEQLYRAATILAGHPYHRS